MSANVVFPSFARHHAMRAPRGPMQQLWAALRQAARVVGTRRYLAQMDDRMLADVGISRADAAFEAARAPWDTSPR